MKARNVIRDFNLNQIKDDTDLSSFITYFYNEAFLKFYNDGTPKSFSHFKACLTKSRKEWDSISKPLTGKIPERYWKFFYARFIVPLRDLEYPEHRFDSLFKLLRYRDFEITYNVASQVVDYLKVNNSIEHYFTEISPGLRFLLDAFMLNNESTTTDFDNKVAEYLLVLKRDRERTKILEEFVPYVKQYIKFKDNE